MVLSPGCASTARSCAGLSHPQHHHSHPSANPASDLGLSSNTAPVAPVCWDHFNHWYPVFPDLSCSDWPVSAATALPAVTGPDHIELSTTQPPFSTSVHAPLPLTESKPNTQNSLFLTLQRVLGSRISVLQRSVMLPLHSDDERAHHGPESGLLSTETSAKVLFSFRARSELALRERAMDALQDGDRTPRS